jgi:hypothetical protein
MNDQKIALQQDEQAALRYEVSDAEIEAAAQNARSYTYQTSAYNRCCR